MPGSKGHHPEDGESAEGLMDPAGGLLFHSLGGEGEINGQGICMTRTPWALRYGTTSGWWDISHTSTRCATLRWSDRHLPHLHQVYNSLLVPCTRPMNKLEINLNTMQGQSQPGALKIKV